MPEYTFRCNKCGQTFTRFLSLSDRCNPTKEYCCSDELTIEQIILTPPQVVGRDTLSFSKRLPGEWKDFLHKLEQKHPNSNMKNTKIY